MAIPVILRGDTSSIIRLSVAEGDYTDCILEVSFFGVLRQFKNVVGNSVITLEWTAEETANFPLGTNCLLVLIRRGDFVRTLPFPKVKVTDAPAEVYEGTIEIAPKLFDLPDLTAESSLGEVKTTLNAIKDVLRGGLALFLSVILLSSNAAELTPDTQINDVKGSTTISEFVTAAGVTVGGGTDGEAVTNITERILRHKVFATVDRKRDIDELGYGKPVIEDFADFIVTIEGENPVRVPWIHAWQCYQLNGEKMINIQITQTGKYYMLAFWVIGDGDATFTDAMVREYPITEFVFGNGRYRGKLDKTYPDRLALKSEVLSKEEVKETIKEANGGVWDQKLEVWWTPKMENGKLTYQATTNVNIQAEN